jgi:hypothetical protein
MPGSFGRTLLALTFGEDRMSTTAGQARPLVVESESEISDGRVS